ncbi:MAG TPA: hypothetical protein VI483_02740 [Candidatus Paceibacterota bacterium]
MAYDDEHEETIDEGGLHEAGEEDADLEDEGESNLDMFGGEDPEAARDRDWM